MLGRLPAAVMLVWLLGPAVGLAERVRPPEVGLELLAETTAVVPGQTVELAVRFDIEHPWHIYWENSGDSGYAPSFDWTLPEGYEVGPLRYPAPTREVAPGDLHTYILEGEPAILTTLTVPEGAEPGGEVTLGLASAWLVCTAEVCIPQEGEASLTLPVAADREAVEPANEAAFREARAAQPVEMAEAPHLDRLEAVVDVEQLAPDMKFQVAVVFDIPEGHHINAHKVLDEAFIPTDVFPRLVEGVYLKHAVFPEGLIEKVDALDMELAVYRGRTVVIVPGEGEWDLSGEEVRLSGVATYAVCNDETGQCYPPSAAAWEVTVPVAAEKPDEPVLAAAHRELFAAGVVTGGVSTGAVMRAAPEDPDAAAVAVEPGGGGFLTWLIEAQSALDRLGVAGWLFMAFVGGLILNLMPCVLPVVSIKILSFVNQAKEDRGRIFTLGLAFSGGILASFMVLGVLILALDQTYGGLFQYPQVVIGLAAVVLAFALSLFGVFSLNPPRVVNELGEKVSEEGHLNAFGMGLLATVLGTACTAPFLSFVLAIAAAQPAHMGFLLFTTAGFGMAIPYVVLAAKPAWVRLVPKPGPWMKTFEHVMGFVLVATVIWLLSIAGSQLGARGLVWTLVFLLAVAIGTWFYGRVEYGAATARKVRGYGGAVACVVLGWVFCFQGVTTISALQEAARAERAGMAQVQTWDDGKIPWVPYTRERAMEMVEQGYTVFIDYTADWCVNCKVFERTVIDTAPVRATMERLGVVPFIADFTNRDPEIREDLDRYQRAGVPMYLIIPAFRPDEVVVLDALTQGTLIAHLEQAGPSRPVEEAAPDPDAVAAAPEGVGG